MTAEHVPPRRHSAVGIDAVAVVVPAHDEEALVGGCLEALDEALDAAVREVADLRIAVCVVLDRCSDATPRVVRDAVGRWHRPAVVRTVVTTGDRTVGELRTLGLDDAVRRLGDVPPGRVWLLSTDADTRVPPTWVRDHLRHAGAGADAVVGMVDLDGLTLLPDDVQCRYTDLVDAGITPDAHTHAYAANLGVRADAFQAVGGFPVVAAGEEHALLAALRGAGRRIVTPVGLRVRTSARTHGRAAGGLADLLRDLGARTAG
ncbi:glycosyltransferase family 2 protein [Pseudonocardia sp. N23]|uniref:glycosyltransferase n=1 Tax=Pseudonocardia sp. N23 TaxID=1987376 RepID=UPI000BFC4B1D|nr:glycosyltransferase family 2 protein [Pseudonocardia sp. N23]GAY08021.1 glycosyl transferase, group 2 family protein [Pseudonocardia sp. N23]